MPILKKGTVIPTDAEDKKINKGIASDPDTYELSSEEFKQLKPVGRPFADVRLQNNFRNTGKGWQTRIDKILLDYVEGQQ